MRVIGGALRSRRLVAPPGGARPTSDRVRAALFDQLGDRAGARVLDLFAGSGALGIEALSRGAEAAVFVDAARASIAALRRNIEALSLGAAARVLASPAARALRVLAGEGARFDAVFVDPPYDSNLYIETLSGLRASGALAPNAVVVVERSKRHALEAAAVVGYKIERERAYGDTVLVFLCPHEAMVAGDVPPTEALES